MNPINPNTTAFINNAKQWQAEYKQLRAIVLDCGLTEAYKWGVPCYALDESNVVLIHGFKEYCALLFFKGALLKDDMGLLVQQTENVQAARQMRFTSEGEIVELAPVIKAYIQQAMEVEKAGLKVEFKKTTEFNIPDEFQEALENDPALKAAFETLTPGRQRSYLLYFSSAKQSKTRTARVEKYRPHIMAGKGLNDR